MKVVDEFGQVERTLTVTVSGCAEFVRLRMAPFGKAIQLSKDDLHGLLDMIYQARECHGDTPIKVRIAE